VQQQHHQHHHQPAFDRDSVVAHASGDAASDAVPLPEPDRQPTPQIDVNWLNAVIDSTVKVGEAGLADLLCPGAAAASA
jgi:hypothetical protein